MYLPEHSHCLYCGNPVKYGEEYCDDDCKRLHEAREKDDKRKDMRFYVAIAASLILILVVGIVLKLTH